MEAMLGENLKQLAVMLDQQQKTHAAMKAPPSGSTDNDNGLAFALANFAKELNQGQAENIDKLIQENSKHLAKVLETFRAVLEKVNEDRQDERRQRSKNSGA